MKAFTARTATRTARLAALALAGAAALALTACSSGSPTTGAAGSTNVSSKDTAIKVAVAPIQFETAYIAQQQGYFTKNHLDVTIVNGSDPASNVAQVVSGGVQISTGSLATVVQSVSKGIGVQIISGNGVVSKTDANTGVIVRANSGIKNVLDLQGKTVGINGLHTGLELPLLQEIKAQGGDPSKVKLVAIPYPGMQAAIEKGAVDAVMPTDQFYTTLKSDPKYADIAQPVKDYQGGMVVTAWTASTNWLSKNATAAKEFNTAMSEAISYYNDPSNVDKVRAITAKVSKTDISTVATTLPPMQLKIDDTPTKGLLAAMKDYGYLTSPIAVDKVIWSGAPQSK